MKAAANVAMKFLELTKKCTEFEHKPSNTLDNTLNTINGITIKKAIIHATLLVVAWIFYGQLYAQDKVRFNDIKELTIDKYIDSTYVFAYRLIHSRSTRGAIWNLKTHEAETPENYSQIQLDTINGEAVTRLYRQVVWSNHPLNGWEIWIMKGKEWQKLVETPSKETTETKEETNK